MANDADLAVIRVPDGQLKEEEVQAKAEMRNVQGAYPPPLLN